LIFVTLTIFLGLLLMMRDRVMRIGHADLRIRDAAELATQHERDHSSEVGLVGQDLQIAHQPDVLVVGCRDARGMIEDRQFLVALLLGFLDAPLDVADGVQVLDQLHAIARAERALEVCDFIAHGIEHAAILFHASETRAGIGVLAVSEEALEHGAWIVLGGQRCRGTQPRDRVRVRAGESDVARPGGFRRLDGQFERCELRGCADFSGCDLIHRDAGIEPRLTGRRRDIGEEARARLRMRTARTSRTGHARPGC
jgi:hypothetical protein